MKKAMMSKKKMSKKQVSKLRRLLRHLGRHKGKYGFLSGFVLGGASGIKRGLGLANYSPGDKRTFRDIKAEQKALRRLLQQKQTRR